MVAAIAAELGKPLTPLQRYIADVANEVDSRGRFCYRSVVVLAPRRTGKSALMEPILTHRGEQRRCEMAMTAATGELAVELFEEITQDLIESPVADRFARTKSQGYAKLEFARTGSRLRAVTPNPKIGHSKSLRLMWVDEFWAHTGAQLKAMRAGYRPAFLTTGGQEFLTSTAGTTESDAFIRTRLQGRADVEAGRNSGRAFFDIAAPLETPDGVPLEDLSDDELMRLLAENHPAVGHLFTAEDLVELMLLDMEDLGGRPGLLRAYGNLTQDMGAAEWPPLFDDDLMERQRGGKVPDGARVAFGVAVDPDRRDAVIAVAWRGSDGRALTSYRRAEGTRWLVPEVVRLVEEYGASCVGIRSAGPARDIADALEVRGVPVLRLSQPDDAAAGTRFHDEFLVGSVLWDGSAEFSGAVGAAEAHRVQSGLEWRSRTGAPVTCLPAGSAALWAFDHAPVPEPARPRFRIA